METATISVNTDEFWHSCTLPIYSINYKTEEPQIVNIPNCCLEELPADTEEWFNNNKVVVLNKNNNKVVVLVKTEIEPVNKKIHFRNDHGTNILLNFAEKIVNFNYVCSVINSLEFHPYPPSCYAIAAIKSFVNCFSMIIM